MASRFLVSPSEPLEPSVPEPAARRRYRTRGLRCALSVPVVCGAVIGAGEASAVVGPDGTEAAFCLPPPVTPPVTPPVKPPVTPPVTTPEPASAGRATAGIC